MYICGLCQNKTYFKEQNLFETEFTVDSTGEITATAETFVVCEAIICGQCGASTEDGHILYAETGEPFYGGAA